jgi:4a-hydroxytetrahydrobiopterin dehydratase
MPGDSSVAEVERLSGPAVDAAIDDLGLNWRRDGDALIKTVTWEDFAEAMHFVGEVAMLAEAADHHPDIAIHWNRVDLRLWTHVAHGITTQDFDLAGQIDALTPAVAEAAE